MLFFLHFVFLPLLLCAQQRVRGEVRDMEGKPLPGVVVKAFALGDSLLLGYAMTNGRGEYDVSLRETVERVRLSFAGLGLRTVEREARVGEPVPLVKLEEALLELQEVTVKAVPVMERNDTLVYNVAQLADGKDRTIEDVIRKIPGVEVEDNGQIRYNGEPINKFYIEGMDMLGGRYALATRNIQPDDIASVSVYENHQPKRVLQGIEHTDRAALNLTLKRNRMLRPIVTAMPGVGYGGEALWKAEGTGLFVASGRQALVTAKGNNAASLYKGEGADHVLEGHDTRPLATDLLESAASGTPRLPATRYAANRSGAASLNLLNKQGSDRVLTVNGGYTHDGLSTAQRQESTYWREGQPALSTYEDLHSRTTVHAAWLTLTHENNGHANYLKEHLSLRGEWRRLTDRVDDGLPLRQRIRTDSYQLDNALSAIWRRGRRVVDFSSSVSLAQVPRGSMLAVYALTDSQRVAQEVEGLRFQTTERVNLKHIFNRRSSLALEGELMADYHRLDAQSQAEAASLWQPSVYKGHELRIGLSPVYQYEAGRLRWRTALPLEFVSLRYTARGGTTSCAYHRPQLEGNTMLLYRLRVRWHFTLNAGYSRTLGGLDAVVQQPIHTTYRQSTVLGTGVLDRTGLFVLGASGNYRNTMRGLNGSVRTLWQHNRSRRTAGTTISDSATETLWLPRRSTMDFWNVYGNLAKNAFHLNTIFTLNTHLSLMQTETLRQGQPYDLRNTSLSMRGAAQTALWDKRLMLHLQGQYTLSLQRIGSAGTQNRRSDWMPSFALSFFPVRRWEAYAHVSGVFVEGETGHFSGNAYMDAGLRYRSGKRVEAELAATNLTDRRHYTVRRFADLDTYTYVYQLRPREGLATLRIRL